MSTPLALPIVVALSPVWQAPRHSTEPLSLKVSDLLTTPFTVLRLLTPLKVSYEVAEKRAEPYTKIVQELPEMRRDTVELVKKAASEKRKAYVLVNNRSEGNAPLRIQTLRNALQVIGSEGWPVAVGQAGRFTTVVNAPSTDSDSVSADLQPIDGLCSYRPAGSKLARPRSFSIQICDGTPTCEIRSKVLRHLSS